MTFSVNNAEFTAWAKETTLWTEDKFHAVMCDPPYGISFMGKEWDKPDAFRRAKNENDVGRENVFGRASRTSPEYQGGLDFQGQVKLWGEAMMPLLYPGALVFMFGGTRMWHRLAAGMEDAGFHLWDTMMWLHGQGFPKGQDISKLIDKQNGDERTEVIGRYQPPGMDKPWNLRNAKDERTIPLSASSRNNLEILAPGSEQSAPWVGHKTPQLKPAWEPILCFKAPTDERYVDLALKYGSGALNIDAGRIGWPDGNVPAIGTPAWGGPQKKVTFTPTADGETKNRPEPNSSGRYPANVILDETSAPILDEQTGVLTSGARTGHRNQPKTKNAFGKFKLTDETPSEGSSGGASRFFYCAKASTSERNAGVGEKNNHPTVKPIDLNRWLASLLLPPSSVGVRRLLVPFSGSGSEMIGAIKAGWDDVVGVEMNAEYCKIAEARINHHTSNTAKDKETA